MHALHACFLYDAGRLVDEDLFRRLLPALVAQLSALPPPEVLPALAADAGAQQSGAAEAAAGNSAEEGGGDHVYGRAAVDALVELAVCAGTDTLWKPLNYQVLHRIRMRHIIPCCLPCAHNAP